MSNFDRVCGNCRFYKDFGQNYNGTCDGGNGENAFFPTYWDTPCRCFDWKDKKQSVQEQFDNVHHVTCVDSCSLCAHSFSCKHFGEDGYSCTRFKDSRPGENDSPSGDHELGISYGSEYL